METTSEDELTILMREIRTLILRTNALETRVSRQEGIIRGLVGKVEELSQR